MKFQKIRAEDENDEVRPQTQHESLSRLQLIYLLYKTCRYYVLFILALVILTTLVMVMKKTEEKVVESPDEMLDEHGIIRAEGNSFPSKHQVEAQTITKIFFDEIANSTINLTNPTDKLLIGISSAVKDIQRRHLFRAHQIQPYNEYKEITWKFFLFEPPANFREAIKYENETYGDIIILEGISDTRENARAIKPFEIFTYVEKHMSVYKYVAKIDTDTFLNVPDFYKEYFNETVQNMEYTIIAPICFGRFNWPMGAFEALSWKLVRILNKLYKYVKRTSYAEDLQIGWYLFDAGIKYDFVQLEEDRAFEFRGPNHGPGDIPYNAIRIHELKYEEIYLMIAGCFNKDGVNKTYIDEMRALNWTTKKP
jgi:hypothetical protein